MPAFLIPDGKRRLVVDRVFNLGGGRHLAELQDQFFYMTGDFLDNEALAGELPEPYKTRALAFVKKYLEAKAKESKMEQMVENTTIPSNGLTVSEELLHLLDIRTSDERAQEGRE